MAVADPEDRDPEPEDPRSTAGAPSSYTDAGPPDSTMPAGRREASSEGDRSWATISENTWHSRILRAISCAYCAPRSTTRTGRPGPAATSLVAHPDALGGLVRLALALIDGATTSSAFWNSRIVA